MSVSTEVPLFRKPSLVETVYCQSRCPPLASVIACHRVLASRFGGRSAIESRSMGGHVTTIEPTVVGRRRVSIKHRANVGEIVTRILYDILKGDESIRNKLRKCANAQISLQGLAS